MKASEKALERVSGDDSKCVFGSHESENDEPKINESRICSCCHYHKIRENRFILSSFSFFSTQTMRIPLILFCGGGGGASSLRFIATPKALS
jgi:hypothetical protein